MRKWIDLFENTARTLYHGTLKENLPEIEKRLLVPTVGSFVSDFYDRSGDEDYEAERDSLEPLVFAAQKQNINRCVTAIIWRLRQKNIPVTPENVIRYGAIIAIKDRDNQFYHASPDEFGYAQHPEQVEPNDFYSYKEAEPFYVYQNAKLKDLLRRNLIDGFYSMQIESVTARTIAPDIGAIVEVDDPTQVSNSGGLTAGKRRYVVKSWMKAAPEPEFNLDDDSDFDRWIDAQTSSHGALGDIIFSSHRRFNDGKRLMWCVRSEAEYLGLGGTIAAVKDVKVIGKVNWPAERISEMKRSALRKVGEMLFTE